MNSIHLEAAKKIIRKTSTVFWFRRDLRLYDNAGLYQALRDSKEVIPLFIFDTTILSRLEEKSDRRVHFIHHSLQQLSEALESVGSTLIILQGIPREIFQLLDPARVYTNHDYEPYARKRDADVQQILTAKGCAFHSCKDQVIFEKNEVSKDDERPYTVFTPFSKKWKASISDMDLCAHESGALLTNLRKTDPLPFPSLADIGFATTDTAFPGRDIRSQVVEHYTRGRDYPALDATSRLSVHLRFGTISIRNAVSTATKLNETWLNELIWREFYQMILWNFPHVENSAFKPAYNSIEWRNDEREFEAWCEGKTGYPMVDAGMRELNTTGFMHNRLRMITASFLTKHLLIDYRWGEAYFAKKLLDYDLAANNGGWQWAAGSGCDAVPYFRIFNPALQRAKFDKDSLYINKWVPEVHTRSYPEPIVDHDFARRRALLVYKTALNVVP
ncbi:MAG: deoxyribodipyrimidine photo-lyase [Chryseosolibacter sp.]